MSAVLKTPHGTLYEAGSSELGPWDEPKLAATCNEAARPGYDTCNASEYLDTKATLQKKVGVLADMLKRGKGEKGTVVYTGAGVSTASGVPDYASKAKGSVAPHRRATDTRQVNRLDTQPTLAHHVLAALEQAGLVHHWVQQNHDRLAQKAGYPQDRLNEIHGAWGDDKNQVVMMSDKLRDDLTAWLVDWCSRVKLCLAMGTSLCGMTSDSVAIQAGNVGGLVIINLQPTSLDDRAALRIWGTLDTVLGMLGKTLRLAVPNKQALQRGVEWVQRHPRCKYNTPRRKPNQ